MRLPRMRGQRNTVASSAFSGDMGLYCRALYQARPYWNRIAAIFALDLLGSPLGLLAPLPLKIVVDNAVNRRPLPDFFRHVLPRAWGDSPTVALLLAAALLMLITVASQIQGFVSSLLKTHTTEKLLLDFRALIFRHLQRMSLSWHDSAGSADALYRIQYDAPAIQYISMDGTIPFVTSAVTLATMFYVTIRIDWQLTSVAVGISPLLWWLSRRYRPMLRQQSRDAKRQEHSALAVIQEAMAALRVVKAFGREDQEEERYVRHSKEGMRVRLQLALDQGRYGFFVGVTTTMGTVAVLWLGVRHVIAGSITLGNLLVVMAYFSQLYGPLKTFGQKAAGLQGYFASLERVFEVLDRDVDVCERPDARPLVRAQGAISYRDVCFGYDPQQPVLQFVSFEVPAGGRVGIAGKTGAGKTTLLNLLARFYDVDAGQILLDGVDIRAYKVADLRNQFALVLQEPVLFSTTIAENIAYARPDASETEIMAAAKFANAHDFIVRFPEGYRTRVGERGMCLSGGERQRISLARAFLKDAPILLLDEPTSSIDVETEAQILDALERLMRGRTTFMIAHRIGTLKNCDLRLELENGQLVVSAGMSHGLVFGGRIAGA